MGFTVEQDCPQCGAPVELDETDHLMKCPYCHVNNFLYSRDYFRYVLPHKAPNKEIIYAPYLRFKGNIYFCKGFTVGHRVVDITHVGLSFKGLPGSLGFRPQAMKMRFVTTDTQGSFLKFSLKAAEILSRAGKLSSGSSAQEILHRAYIGETLSLIYLPLYVESNALFDAILNRRIAQLSEDEETLDDAVVKNPRWKLTFMATLCPQCGWNLEGERDSVVLTCSNCETVWEALKGRFSRINFFEVPGQSKDTQYLPFWKISARAKGVDIASFADFIRVTNQPRVIGKDWEDDDMNYWCPAFKIRPKIFLNLSKQFTVSQKHFQAEEVIPKKNVYPVTLPSSEAIQSLKVILASSTLYKKRVFPHLPRVKFNIKGSTLVYLPFRETGQEMIQEQMQISINKNTLEFGRYL